MNIDIPYFFSVIRQYFSLPKQSQCSAEAAFMRHCRTNLEYDTTKIVPMNHLAHIDFWPVTVSCVGFPMPKITLFFYRNSCNCNGCFDWCIGFLICTGISIQ